MKERFLIFALKALIQFAIERVSIDDRRIFLTLFSSLSISQKEKIESYLSESEWISELWDEVKFKFDIDWFQK